MSKTKNNAAIAERRERAFRLRVEGHEPSEIARIMGTSTSIVNTYIRDGVRSSRMTTKLNAQEVRELEMARLDAVVRASWQPMQEGSAAHATVVANITKERLKLTGLDDPDVGVPGDTLTPREQYNARVKGRGE